MIRFAPALALFGALVLIPDRAFACAGCRNPNMPVTRVEAVHLRPGELRASASLGATGVHVTHEAGCADLAVCSELPVQRLHLHDQKIFPGELRAVGEMGITASLGVELQLPFRVVRTTVEYTTPDGRPFDPLDPGIHHRDETLAGFGDPMLLTRWSGESGGILISARAGLTLPIGETEPNPFILGEIGRSHQHIQFGSGTFDPVVAFDISKAFGPWLLLGHMQGQTAFYENRHGFRAGTRVSGGLQGGRRIWRSVSGALGGEVMYEGAERWDGKVRQDGNLGRTELLAALSLVQAFRTASLGLSARVPVYRHIVIGDEPPGTISSPLMLGLFVSRTFRVM